MVVLLGKSAFRVTSVNLANGIIYLAIRGQKGGLLIAMARAVEKACIQKMDFY